MPAVSCAEFLTDLWLGEICCERPSQEVPIAGFWQIEMELKTIGSGSDPLGRAVQNQRDAILTVQRSVSRL